MSRSGRHSPAGAGRVAGSQRPGSDKRDRILRSARALFANKGFAATTVSQIVRDAGVAQGTFYLYFPSKGEILNAFAEQMRHEMTAAVEPVMRQERPLRELIEPFVQAAFDVASRYRDVLGMAEAEAMLRRADQDVRRTARFQQIESMLRRDQAAGWLDPTLDARIAARLISGVLERAARDCFRDQIDIPVAHYRQVLIDFIRRALGNSPSPV